VKADRDRQRRDRQTNTRATGGKPPDDPATTPCLAGRRQGCIDANRRRRL